MKTSLKRSYKRIAALLVLAVVLLTSAPSLTVSASSAVPPTGRWDPKQGIHIGTERNIGLDMLRSYQLIPYAWQGAKASTDAGYGWLAGAIDGSLMAIEGEYFSTPAQMYNVVSDRFTTTGDDLLGSAVPDVTTISPSTSNMYYSYTGDTNTTTNNYRVFTDLSSNDTYNYQWYNPITNDYNYTDYFYYDMDYNTYYYNYTQNNYKFDYFYTDNRTYNTFYIIQTDTETGESVEYFYNIFYQLPDGRSSYNLKKEDVWGEYLIYKTRPYELVAEDDGKTLGLWHFDQSLEDSSYWNNSVGTSGNLQYQEGMFGKGKYIKGDTNISLTLPLDKAAFDRSQPFTLEWIENTPAVQGTSVLTDKKEKANHQYPQWTDRYYFYDITDYNLLICPDYSYANISSHLGENTYYAVTYDGNTYALYINGIKQNSKYNNGIHNYMGWMNTDSNYSLYNGIKAVVESKSNIAGVEITNASIKFKCEKTFYERDFDTAYSSDFPNETDDPFRRYTYKSYYSVSHYNSVIDEMRLSKGVLYTADYAPSAEPYTTNMVLALPPSPKENEIFFYTGYAYEDYRIGGARPTYPSDGFIYVYLEDDIVKSVQQYQANKWVDITATIYQNGTARDLKNYSLADFKLHGPDGSTGENPGGSTGENPGGTVSGNNPGGNPGGDQDDDKGNWFTKFLGNLADFLGSAVEKIFTVLSETVFGLLGQLIDSLAGLIGKFFGMIKDVLSTVGGFLNGDFAQFLYTTFGFIPQEIWEVILLGLELTILAGIIKLVVNLVH